MSIKTTYKYEPLALDGSVFRLIELLPGEDHEPFRIQFIMAKTSSPPAYTALSYAWGDGTPVTTADVEGSVIGVAKNLSHALKRLRHPEKSLTYWIDAICINQEDDIEKGAQVALMQRLYQRAQMVMIYLGEDADRSEEIMDLFPKISNAYKVKKQEGQGRIREPLKAEELPVLGLPTVLDPEWDVLRQFLRRPWFSRVWVVQEAILSTDAYVVCGSWSGPFLDIMGMIIGTYELGLPIHVPPRSLAQRGQISSAVRLILYMNRLGAGTDHFEEEKCIDLLQRMRIARASNPRDYCFGLFGLSKELGDPAFKVDYIATTEEVYARWARSFVRQGDGVKVLYSAGGGNSNLPSWVPDWSWEEVCPPTIFPSPWGDGGADPACAAATSFIANIQLKQGNDNVLVVAGVFLGTIDVVGERYVLKDLTNDASERHVYASMSDGYKRSHDTLLDEFEQHRHLQSTSDLFLVTRCISELFELFTDGAHTKYPSGEDLRTVMYKTLVCNQSWGSYTASPASYSQAYDAFLLYLQTIHATWCSPHPIKHKEMQYEDHESLLTQFRNDAAAFTWTHRRGRIRDGYVGQFPLDTRADDQVFLPFGSAVPFVVRPSTREPSRYDLRARKGTRSQYKLIGSCYVHGLMQGHAVKPGTIGQEVELI